MTEAEDSMQKMRVKTRWLYEEVSRQHRLGNSDTARRFEMVAKAATEILEGLTVYISRNPRATRKDLKEILQHIANEN